MGMCTWAAIIMLNVYYYTVTTVQQFTVHASKSYAVQGL